MEERAQSLTDELNRLRSEHYSLAQEHSQKTEQLQAEMENSVNYEYVKNILISYFSSGDASVHQNLQRVLFTALKFSNEE